MGNNCPPNAKFPPFCLSLKIYFDLFSWPLIFFLSNILFSFHSRIYWISAQIQIQFHFVESCFDTVLLRQYFKSILLHSLHTVLSLVVLLCLLQSFLRISLSMECIPRWLLQSNEFRNLLRTTSNWHLIHSAEKRREKHLVYRIQHYIRM